MTKNAAHNEPEVTTVPSTVQRPLPQQSHTSTSFTVARKKISKTFRSSTPKFPQFSLLPSEIRLQIWEASLQPRVHELHPCAKLYSNRMTFRSNSSQTPSIFHVCSESRNVAEEHYKLMEYSPPRGGMSGKGILRFYFAPKLDTLLLNSLMGLFIMFMLLENEEDYVAVGVMKGWENVAFDAERVQLITLLSGVAGHAPQPRFKEVFPSLKELIIAFDYTSKGKTRFRTSVWPGENGTSLQRFEAVGEELNGTFDSVLQPMKAYLQNDYGGGRVVGEVEETVEAEGESGVGGDGVGGFLHEVPSISVAKVKRKTYIRGDIRYAFRWTCSIFGVRPRGILRRL